MSDFTEPGRSFDLDEEGLVLTLAACPGEEVFALSHSSSVGDQLCTVLGLPQIIAVKPSSLHTGEEGGFLLGSRRAPSDRVSCDARSVLFNLMAFSLGSYWALQMW